jgi:hypothetical protein
MGRSSTEMYAVERGEVTDEEGQAVKGKKI